MSEPAYTTPGKCRVCGSTDLTPLFSLGDQYVSNFVPADQVTTGPRCPIELELCRACTLVQARHTARQDFLYTRHYWFRSGCTVTLRDALRDVVDAACRLVKLEEGDVVVDVGSNDGTLLRYYQTPGLFRVGVEPATNLATQENYDGLDLIADFWSAKAFNKWVRNYHSNCDYGGENECECPSGKAQVITACGMFYDLEDPNAFIRDVAAVLASDGVFIAQLMCLKQTLEKGDVGNLAHEHLLFFSLRSLDILLNRHGLRIFDIQDNAVNGGSYRLYICHRNTIESRDKEGRRRVSGWMLAEEEPGYALHDPATYAPWFDHVKANRDACVSFLRAQRARGNRIWILGASTKANVIAQFYGLTPELIDAAAERSPEKVGLHMVGTGIPIRSEEDFRQARPDYALVMPYAFRVEIMEREKEWHAAGGRFVFPLPQFEVV